MSEDKESWILKARGDFEEQPELFPDENIPKIDKTKPHWECTGEKLFRERPDVYQGIVKALVTPGASVRWICRTYHVSDHTLRSVKERERIALATQKNIILSNLAHGAQLASERVIEGMPTASVKDALIGVGILVDKMQLLSGEVTARIGAQHTERRVSSLEEYEQQIGLLEKKARARMIEAGRGMQLLAENNFSKEGDAGAVGPKFSSAALVDSESPESAVQCDPVQTSGQLPAVADPKREQDLFGLEEGRVA